MLFQDRLPKCEEELVASVILSPHGLYVGAPVPKGLALMSRRAWIRALGVEKGDLSTQAYFHFVSRLSQFCVHLSMKPVREREGLT